MRVNALLEMLFALPIAFLFLFAATDFGLNALEAAKIRDSVRRSVAEPLTDQVPPQLIAKRIAKRIGNELQYAKRHLGMQQGQFLVEVAAIELEVTPQTGELLLNQFRVHPIVRESGSSLNSITPLSDKSAGEILKIELAKQVGKVPSNFAVPSGAGFLAVETGRRYLRRAVAVLILVRTMSNSIGPDFTKLIFGRSYGVRQVSLLPLRNMRRSSEAVNARSR